MIGRFHQVHTDVGFREIVGRFQPRFVQHQDLVAVSDGDPTENDPVMFDDGVDRYPVVRIGRKRIR